MYIWDLQSRKVVQTLDGHSGAFVSRFQLLLDALNK